VFSAACADTIRKLLELGEVAEAKEWTLLQIKLAASLGTDGSLIRVYERDRNLANALSVSSAAAVITPILKEEFKIARANGVVPYSNKRFFRNPTYARSFSDSSGRRFGLNDRGLFSQAFQSGFANGLNVKQWVGERQQQLGQPSPPKNWQNSRRGAGRGSKGTRGHPSCGKY
jgi:hypothetical protein